MGKMKNLADLMSQIDSLNNDHKEAIETVKTELFEIYEKIDGINQVFRDLAGDYSMLACNADLSQAILYNWKGYSLIELNKEPLNNELYFFFPGHHMAQFLNQFKLNKFLSTDFLRKTVK